MEPSSPLRCCGNKDETLNLNNDLEKMIEITENITLKLTWMAYDMAAQRTNPEPRILMQNLEEAQSRCRAAVYGDRDQKTSKCPDSAAAAAAAAAPLTHI